MSMKTATLLLACFSTCLSALAQTKPAATPAGKSALDKAALEAYLRHLELWIPQVTVSIDDPKPSKQLPDFMDVAVHLSYNGATKDESYYVSKDGRKVLKGDVYDINQSPFQSNLDNLKTDLQPSFGAAGAPVVLVVFGDFQCPNCKSEAEVMRKNVPATFPDKVRVYFKDFPLETIHPWARTAAITGRCVFRESPSAFWQYHDWIYENQSAITLENINEKVQDFAKEKGVDGMQLGRCVESKATEADVNRNIAEGRALGVAATPTTYINGRKMEGALNWEAMEALIRLELDHQAKTPDAGEQCCTVTIPKVGK
jgi:protein-disulfide isomerase